MSLAHRRPALRVAILALGWTVAVLLNDSPVHGDEEAIAEEAAVVSDEEGVVSDDDAGSVFTANQVVPRMVGDRLAYIRQSTEAFADPDRPKGLELKYYFLLEADAPWTKGNLARDPAGARDVTLAAGEPAPPAPLAKRLPLTISPDSTADLAVEWQDYLATPALRNLVLLLRPAGENALAKLLALRVEGEGSALTIKKISADREFPAAELPSVAAADALLDTFDRPAGLSAKAAMFGRLTAVLKMIDGRHAVDLYSERLHPDSDCRVWLTPVDHPWGRAVSVGFRELPIRRKGDQVVDVTVLSVAFENRTGQRTQIAFDYPLCSPALVEQFRKTQAQQAKQPATTKSSQPDLAKMLGEDVVAEFESRLVNAPYK